MKRKMLRDKLCLLTLDSLKALESLKASSVVTAIEQLYPMRQTISCYKWPWILIAKEDTLGTTTALSGYSFYLGHGECYGKDKKFLFLFLILFVTVTVFQNSSCHRTLGSA